MPLITNLLLSLTISIQTNPTDTQQPLGALFHCDTITAPNERNTCFSRETERIKLAIADGTLVVVNQRLAREISASSFGRRNEPPLSSSLEIEAPDQISSTISSSGQFAEGKYHFTLADGSTWLQTDSDPIRLKPRDGTAVTVKRAALGSYFLRIGNGRDIRVRRTD